MKSLIRWAVHNSPGMNALMIAILVLGGFSLIKMRREVFPQFELEIVLVTVQSPNSSPEQIEETVCQRIEEKVRAIDGIKKVTSVAATGAGNVIIELKSDVKDVERVRGEIESAVAQVERFFPQQAEKPVVQQLTFPRQAIRVAVLGPDDSWKKTADLELDVNKERAQREAMQLRLRTEEMVDDLLNIDGISDVAIMGAPQYQIDVDVREETLKRFDLTRSLIADRIRQANEEPAAGKAQLPSGDLQFRAKKKALSPEEIKKIPIVTKQSQGQNVVKWTLGEIADVELGFDDTTKTVSRVNGRPGLVIQVDTASNEDLIQATEAVRELVKNADLPQGYSLEVWSDISIDVKDRLNLLTRNGLQGLLLVFLVLAIFLELKLAFWVALGIPISIFGAGMLLYGSGETLNMLSMFAFLMALGIVVDDAIVIGENIYAHRQMGKSFTTASIEGTHEVFPSVFASVTTTVIAFAPMLFVLGVMGKFIAVLPIAVIAMLVISLIESVLILPGHLSHRKTMFDVVISALFYPFRIVLVIFNWINAGAKAGLAWFIDNVYRPAIEFSMRRPSVVISLAIALMVVAGALVRSGIIPFILFPKLDTREIQGTVIFPAGTSWKCTDEATQRMEWAIREVNNDLKRELNVEQDVVLLVHRTVGSAIVQGARGPEAAGGSHVGAVTAELIDPERRSVTSQEIVRRWREKAGEISGVDTLRFASRSFGPGGNPVEMKLLADKKHFDELKEAVEEYKERLKRYPGTFDTEDDSRPGADQYRFRATQFAQARNIRQRPVVQDLGGAYYGIEVDRLQIGRHEVKLMVRSSEEERRTMASLEDMTHVAADGIRRAMDALLQEEKTLDYSEINRINQQRSITITADVDEAAGNAREIVAAFRQKDVPELLKKYPHVSVRWEGQQEQQQESMGSLFIGLGVALLAMMFLLMVQFRSWLQPLIIFAVIPFGAIGALLGHLIMGLPLTMFSLFGLVALTGVVVNDSIVLIDFINARVRSGVPVKEALAEAGQRRFRPVLLTSITTIAGLLPILAESSFQAQILIPMATSLCFGLLVATVLVLFLVPTLYLLYYRFTTVVENALLGDDAAAHEERSDDESTGT